MFTVYIDDSGTDPNQPMAIASALIIPAARVVALDKEWEKLTKKEGFTEFHTSECVWLNEDSEFAKWDAHKQKRVISRVRQIGKKFGVQAMSLAITKADYNELVPDWLRELAGKYHYTWAIRNMLDMLDRWAAEHRVRVPFEYIYAWGSKSRFFLATRLGPMALGAVWRVGSIKIWRGDFLSPGERLVWRAGDIGTSLGTCLPRQLFLYFTTHRNRVSDRKRLARPALFWMAPIHVRHGLSEAVIDGSRHERLCTVLAGKGRESMGDIQIEEKNAFSRQSRVHWDCLPITGDRDLRTTLDAAGFGTQAQPSSARDRASRQRSKDAASSAGQRMLPREA